MTTSDRVSIRFASKVAQRGYTVAQNIVLFDARLAAPARLLYVQLSHYAWRNPDEFPTQLEIAENLGVHDRQLRSYLAALETRWLLDRRERGLGRAAEYVLYEPAPDYLERPPRPPRRSKRVSSTPVDNSVDGRAGSAIDCRARTATDCRPARQPTAELRVEGGSEALYGQERSLLAVGRAVTRDEHQAVADAAARSLAEALLPPPEGDS